MVPLYKPFMPPDLKQIEDILHSGSLAYGKWGKEFENRLQVFIGEPNIAVVNSYNSAMLVTITTLGIGFGDEVIASPMSCLASNQPFATLGITVIWADIDPEVGTLLPDDVISKITSKTKAIFHNHYCGYPGYINEINEIGKIYGIYIIDDAIEAFGSEYNGLKIGSTGADATVFSFQTVRLPNTIEGGAFAFKDIELFRKAKRIRDYGIRRDTFRDSHGEISMFSEIDEPGYGALLSEVNSYIGVKQMDCVADLLLIQRKNAVAWKANDFDVDFKIIERSFQNPNYWVFGLLATDKTHTINHFRKLGFYASGVHLPNYYYSVFGKSSRLKGVEDFYNKFVALPSGWWV